MSDRMLLISDVRWRQASDDPAPLQPITHLRAHFRIEEFVVDAGTLGK